jgi:hypothetical protein
MADQKISALTPATTPLAGTEVLPIVQSSTTVKVAVSDLTAGRAVSATSIAAGLGAVGTPAYTFTGDLNSGMWSPAADTVAVSTVGAERLRVDSSGNTLVGTTSSTGAATNTAKLIGGVFATVRSSLSVASATPTTIVTLPSGEGNYIVSASLQGSTDPANYNEVAVVSVSQSVTSIAVLVNASVVSLTMSGLDLQVTQNVGTAQTIQFSVLRVL